MMMLKPSKVDFINEKDNIFHELIGQCKYAPPGAKLSQSLRFRLEKFDTQTRSEIVNRVKVGCSPLFLACQKGQTDIVEYLITFCRADIEQKGLYEVADERSSHIVSPLWCAAVAGKLSVVETLLLHGANINSLSDTGSTPVRSACFMTHYAVVKYLVEHGADINKPNYNGGTCLINSVQSAPLCEFLLENGADVNARDIQNKTALHYAIQEHRLETTKLLLTYGADYNAKSRYGDDALQMACLKGATRIFDFLTDSIWYPAAKLADAHDLIGATFLDEHNDMSVALFHWRQGMAIRELNELLPKQPVMPLREGYRMQNEFQSMEELENIAVDADAMKLQSLMIAERILGSHHKDTIFRLMFRGAYYADILRYQRCVNLWRRALEIRVEKDTILYTDTSFTAQALVRLMIDFNDYSKSENLDNSQQRFHDIYSTFTLLTSNIEEMRQLLNIRPTHKRQGEIFDKMLKCITHLIFLMVETASEADKTRLVISSVRDLVRLNPRTVSSNDTLLHLCVSRTNTIKSSYFVHDEPKIIFPNYNSILLLLICHIPVNEKNSNGSTALHLATHPHNYSEWLLQLLLKYDAHIDQPNFEGTCPSDNLVRLSETHPVGVHILDHVDLKCLCATVISRCRIPYKDQIPRTLNAFVELHEL